MTSRRSAWPAREPAPWSASWRRSPTRFPWCSVSWSAIPSAARPSGRPGRPQAFLTAPWQGVCYAPGTWHGVLTPFGQAQDFVVVDRGGAGANLEEFVYDEPWTVALP